MERAPLGLFRSVLLLLLVSCGAPFSTAQPSADPEPCKGPNAEVAGIITGPDGKPVTGAIITYYGLRWDSDCRVGVHEPSEVRSDSSGAYAIRVPLGRGRVLSVERTDKAGFPRDYLSLADVVREGLRADHQFKLFRVVGRVIDASGAPVNGGAVTIYPKTNIVMYDLEGFPAAAIRQGRFESAIHAAGTYVFWVRPGHGGLGVPSRPGHMTISADTSVTIIADAYRVDGVIVDEDGEPIAGALVAVQGKDAVQSSRSDVNGRYSLLLPVGRYRLATYYSGIRSSEPESLLVSGSQRLCIRMKGELRR